MPQLGNQAYLEGIEASSIFTTVADMQDTNEKGRSACSALIKFASPMEERGSQ